MSLLKNPQPSTPKDKLLKAQALIKEKRYTDARRILRTVDHPKAREWLAQLDRIAPELDEPDFDDNEPTPRKPSSRRSNTPLIIAIALAGVGLLAIAAVILFTSQQQQTANANATAVAIAGATSTYEAAVRLVKIDLSSSLTVYCESVAERSQGDCRRWGDEVTEGRFIEALACYDEYDWITDRQNFSLCLLIKGIAVLGNQTFIAPINPNQHTDADLELMGALGAYCQDTRSDDYCTVWSVGFYDQNKAVAAECKAANPESILGLIRCFPTRGIVP